jgi:rod shape-determining protein MreC
MVEVQSTDSVAQQDAVVSAGLSLSNDEQSSYPKGLLIGQVQAVQQDSNALTKTVFIRPALDFAKLDRLLVVTSFTQD